MKIIGWQNRIPDINIRIPQTIPNRTAIFCNFNLNYDIYSTYLTLNDIHSRIKII